MDNGNGIESELGAAFSITEASFEFYYLEDIQAAIVLNATNLAGEGDYVYTTQQY